MLRRAAVVCLVLLAARSAVAQPGAQLLTVFPPGAKAGETVEVTLSGVGFDGAEKLLFSGEGFTAERVGAAVVDPKAPKGVPATSVKFKVTAPKEKVGFYDVRVVSKGGLSNPRAFVVSDQTEVNEAEPNNDVGQAQKVELGTVVNGVISAPTDVDFVSFKAQKGQNVVVYCLTTSIDSKMQADVMVADSDGKQLASNRGYRGGDALLDFLVPKDGEYVVRVAQFAYTSGGPDHFYRLTVTRGPWVGAVFPPLAADGAAVSSWVVPPAAAGADLREPTAPGAAPRLAGANPPVLDNEKNLTAA
ncbi:MAG: PPC domain-containing protein, partial [Gemmataceae bacterium]|nr:PPC domain-containing protein [Gemmataceae bacterium]